MTASEKIEKCKICTKRKFDIQTGLNCSLTGQKPAFESSCENYSVDEVAKEKQLNSILIKREENKGMSTGQILFLALILLSILVRVFLLFT